MDEPVNPGQFIRRTVDPSGTADRIGDLSIQDTTGLREETGLTHECGVFGCIATGDWPSQMDVAQVICLGLVALQHRYRRTFFKKPA